MRIALGIYRLQPRGGLEDNCIRVSEELARRRHDVTLFVAGTHPDLPLPIVSLQSSRKAASNHGRLATFAKAFSRATAGSFDRTVVFQPMPGADVLFLADTLRDRADASFLRRATPRFQTFSRLERSCFGPSAQTRIIGLARPQMEAFVKRYPTSRDRVTIIPPTLSASRRRPELRKKLRATARQDLGFRDHKTVWLWLGLQPEVKGLDRLIELLPCHRDVELLIAGLAATDSKVQPYLSRATQLGVVERIRCVGYVSGDQYFSALAAADVLAHPARLDVTGGVILEAIVNGLPVVATDVCGFAEHIDASGAGMVMRGPFESGTFSDLLDQVGGAANEELSQRGAAYGAKPELYSGISAACDLIEAAFNHAQSNHLDCTSRIAWSSGR